MRFQNCFENILTAKQIDEVLVTEFLKKTFVRKPLGFVLVRHVICLTLKIIAK